MNFRFAPGAPVTVGRRGQKKVVEANRLWRLAREKAKNTRAPSPIY
jgi:hypothetical protein